MTNVIAEATRLLQNDTVMALWEETRTRAVMQLDLVMRLLPPSTPEQAGPSLPAEGLTLDTLKTRLEQRGKSQSDLAQALHVSRAYVCKILSGAKPFTPTMQRKCRQVLNDWTAR